MNLVKKMRKYFRRRFWVTLFEKEDKIMFSKKGFITVCLVILVALLITGCLPNIPSPTPGAVTGVTLEPENMTLMVGGVTGMIVAIVYPSDATNQSITWYSSDPTVASVRFDGEVIPLKAGITTIAVITEDGGKTATCEVTVTP